MRETSARSELLIDALPGEVRAALLKNGRMSEFAVERRSRPSRMGEIFLGRVARVEKGLGAFVDIGLRAHGFLSGRPKGGGPSEGERVLVQVTADAFGAKGPKLSTHILISGPNLALVPGGPGLSAPRARTDEEKARAKALLAHVAHDLGIGKRHGLMARGADLPEDGELLRAEAAGLARQWAAIEAGAKEKTLPARLFGIDDPLMRLLVWFAPWKPDACVIEGADVFAKARGFCRDNLPELGRAIEAHRGPCPLFAAREVEPDIELLSARRMPLPSGASILVEETETLAAIDVDTGALHSRKGSGDMALRANLDAVPEIARQIRLRNIAGLVMADLLRLRGSEQRRRMIEVLRSETASDRVPTHVHGFTATGLVELTRERGRAALSEILFEDWAGEGPGRMARAETVAFDVLRAARRQGMGRHGALRALVSPVVASYLAHEGLADLRAVEAELARTLCIDTDPALAQDRYSIAAL